MSGISCDQELTADGIRRFAVEAFSGLLAGSLDVESLGVDRCSHVSRTLHGTVQIGTYLIDADDEDYLSRSLSNAGNTVGIAVDIDHNTVTGDGIGTGQENIRIVSSHQTGSGIHLRAVDIVVIACFQSGDQSDLSGTHASAHGNGASLRDQLQCLFQRGFFILCVVARHVAGL